jgi:hypothetical protein
VNNRKLAAAAPAEGRTESGALPLWFADVMMPQMASGKVSGDSSGGAGPVSLRIAHLSDLHYPSLDLALWEAVKEAVCHLTPHLIIISGDLVDDPDPGRLRWAQDQLKKLTDRTGAQLYVVPGNHDVFESGIGLGQTRKAVF